MCVRKLVKLLQKKRNFYEISPLSEKLPIRLSACRHRFPAHLERRWEGVTDPLNSKEIDLSFPVNISPAQFVIKALLPPPSLAFLDYVVE